MNTFWTYLGYSNSAPSSQLSFNSLSDTSEKEELNEDSFFSMDVAQADTLGVPKIKTSNVVHSESKKSLPERLLHMDSSAEFLTQDIEKTIENNKFLEEEKEDFIKQALTDKVHRKVATYNLEPDAMRQFYTYLIAFEGELRELFFDCLLNFKSTRLHLMHILDKLSEIKEEKERIACLSEEKEYAKIRAYSKKLACKNSNRFQYLEGSEEFFGKGVMSEVKKVKFNITFKNGIASDEAVFKEEDFERENYGEKITTNIKFFGVDKFNQTPGARSVLTSLFDFKAGFDVIAKAHFGVVEGKTGIAMEVVKNGVNIEPIKGQVKGVGFRGRKYTNWITLEDYFETKQERKDFEEKLNRLYRELSCKYRNDKEIYHYMRIYLCKDVKWDKKYQRWVISNHMLSVDMDDPVLRKKLTELQCMDIFCGQLDRHLKNFYVVFNEKNAKQIVGVKGIDNEAAFPKGLITLKSIRQIDEEIKKESSASFNKLLPNGLNQGVYLVGMPRIIDWEIYGVFVGAIEKKLFEVIYGDYYLEEDALLKAHGQQVEYAKKHHISEEIIRAYSKKFLTKAETEATVSRYKEMRNHFIKLLKQYDVIPPDCWNNESKSLRGKNIPDYFFDTNTSYLAAMRYKLPKAYNANQYDKLAFKGPRYASKKILGTSIFI